MNYRKLTATILAACALSFSWCSCEAAELDLVEAAHQEVQQGAVYYENDGLRLRIPKVYDRQLITRTQTGEVGRIFSVSEKASVEASQKTGDSNYAAGWLFAIGTVSETELHDILCSDMSGRELFARDAKGNYYIYYHPTDVRYERATPEEMMKDQEEWDAACEWAAGVRASFAADNGLNKIYYNGTQIESALGRAAFGKDVKYTISTLEFGPLEPNGVDPVPYYEKMTNGATYEGIELAENEVPDGEYVVLNFPDENIRYDFFFAEGQENIIRQVNGEEGGEQYEYFYKVTFEDGTSKASEIMNEWYHAIAESR